VVATEWETECPTYRNLQVKQNLYLHDVLNGFRVNKTNRCTEFQICWYYYSTCFGQPFCASSGVLSCTSALVYFLLYHIAAVVLYSFSLVFLCRSVSFACLATMNFTIVWPCIVTDSLWIKSTDALNSNVISITTLHVSGSLSVHHQEFLTVHRLWYNVPKPIYR